MFVRDVLINQWNRRRIPHYRQAVRTYSLIVIYVGLIPVWNSRSILKDSVNDYHANRMIEYYCLADKWKMLEIIFLVSFLLIQDVGGVFISNTEMKSVRKSRFTQT